jgi:hypothetical protein
MVHYLNLKFEMMVYIEVTLRHKIEVFLTQYLSIDFPLGANPLQIKSKNGLFSLLGKKYHYSFSSCALGVNEKLLDHNNQKCLPYCLLRT